LTKTVVKTGDGWNGGGFKVRWERPSLKPVVRYKSFPY